MIVNEIFYSLQGEGFLAGIPSVFIRLAGCPLRCRWCDTKYALDRNAGSERSIADIVQTVKKRHCRHVVVTGGEPMINKDLSELAKALKSAGSHLTIETAGIAYVPDMPCDLMSISPKLSNSTPQDEELVAAHDEARLDMAVLGELMDHYDHQLKFVVDSVHDLPEIQETLDELGDVDIEKVMLMPQAADADELLRKSVTVAEMCKMVGFAFSQRLQVLLWGDEKGR